MLETLLLILLVGISCIAIDRVLFRRRNSACTLEISNEQPRFGQKATYQFVWLNGKPCQFTPLELQGANERALQNPEDWKNC
jgi:hypothetical protein